jgi:hypothetical protein
MNKTNKDYFHILGGGKQGIVMQFPKSKNVFKYFYEQESGKEQVKSFL